MENNNEPKEIYTLGIWKVKPGKAKEFIDEWTSFAVWMKGNISGVGKGRLLRDKKDSLRFISFGPWNNENSIQKWRDSEEFKEFVIKVNDLCEEFQPNTLELVSTSE
jgi:heme-degrading monooxygenase HmoA